MATTTCVKKISNNPKSLERMTFIIFSCVIYLEQIWKRWLEIYKQKVLGGIYCL